VQLLQIGCDDQSGEPLTETGGQIERPGGAITEKGNSKENVVKFIQKLVNGSQRALASTFFEESIDRLSMLVCNLIVDLLIPGIPFFGDAGTVQQLIGNPLKSGNNDNHTIPLCGAQDYLRYSAYASGIRDRRAAKLEYFHRAIQDR
jgi:hypothetical protein